MQTETTTPTSAQGAGPSPVDLALALRRPLFTLGQCCATPGALAALDQTGQMAQNFLQMHVLGLWGEVCEEDAQTNREALAHGGRLMSVYRLTDDTKIWVITESDRSVTTVLLPSEY